MRENENGFFVDIHCPENIAEKMEYFINNPEAVEEMGARSLQLCKEKYEVSIINKRMLEIMGV